MPFQQGFAPGADIMGATQQQYQTDLGISNAKNAQNAQMGQAAGGLLAAAMF